jgi:hypothetical protein
LNIMSDTTEFSNYDAANILLKPSRPRLVKCLRRAYAVSYNKSNVENSHKIHNHKTSCKRAINCCENYSP